MAQYDHADTYIIPPNFAKEGTLFSGRAEARNVVEAALVALAGVRGLMFLHLGIKGTIYAGIILVLPLVILAVIGIRGGKFVLFSNPVLFLLVTKKRVLTCPDGQYRLKRNRRIRKHQKKRYRRERKKEKKGR